MNFGLTRAFRIFVCTFALTATLASGRTQDSSAQQPAPDNTKVNKGDNNASQPTADRQKDNASDREVTKQIRQSIVKDKSLSRYAHNVKIIAQNGTVTLKGPVRSDEEKNAVEQKAGAVVGKDKVTSELTIKPKQ